MVVYKFGGATTRTARGLEALVDLVLGAHQKEVTRLRRRRSHKSDVYFGVVLVISAIGHTTRHLSRAAEACEQGNIAHAEELLVRILTQHIQLASSLHLSTLEDVEEEFAALATDIRALMEGIAITRELSLRTRDAFLGNGERLAIVLVRALLQERGLPVTWIDATDLIVTSGDFGHATPLLGETTERAEKLILPRLRRSEIVLTQGFAGATRDGIPTTMGSESSDLTATLLAAALGAEEVAIWKTVPGIFSADPELVPNARLLRMLSFSEAEEIGRRGARILHEAIAHPLRGASHETVLRVATPKGNQNRCTIIQQTLPTVAHKVKPLAIGIEQHLTVLIVRQPEKTESSAPDERSRGPRRSRENAWRELQSNALHSFTSEEETRLVVRREMKSSAIKEILRLGFAVQESGTTLSLLSVVARTPEEGTQIVRSFTLSPLGYLVLKSLRAMEIRFMLPLERSIIVAVSDTDALPALKKLHHDLFES